MEYEYSYLLDYSEKKKSLFGVLFSQHLTRSVLCCCKIVLAYEKLNLRINEKKIENKILHNDIKIDTLTELIKK